MIRIAVRPRWTVHPLEHSENVWRIDAGVQKQPETSCHFTLTIIDSINRTKKNKDILCLVLPVVFSLR